MESNDKKRYELLDVIRKNIVIDEKISQSGREIQQSGQRGSDLADASENIIRLVTKTTGIDFDQQIATWKNNYEQKNAYYDQLKVIPPIIPETSGSATAYMMVEYTDTVFLSAHTDPDQKEEVEAARNNLSDAISGFANKDRAIELLNKLDFSVGQKGEKSPLELFKIALATFEAPVNMTNPSVTSLIPMRECLLNIIKILLKKRPKQEKTGGGNKRNIESIVRQLSQPSISEQTIQIIAEQGHNLLDEISGIKQKEILREKWRELLNKANLFLIEFLQSIDPDKIR